MDKCIGCSRNLQSIRKRKTERIYSINDESMQLFFQDQVHHIVSLGDEICTSCRNKYGNHLRSLKSRLNIPERSSSPQPGPSRASLQPETSHQPPSELDEDHEEIERDQDSNLLDPSSQNDDDNSSYQPEDSGIFQQIVDDSHSEEEETTSSSILPTKKTIRSSSRCIFGCQSPSNLKRIPKKQRGESMSFYRILIPEGARCCQRHLNNVEEWTNIPVKDDPLSLEEYEQAISLVINQIKEHGYISLPALNPDNDDRIKQLTSLSSSSYLDLQSHISSRLHLYLAPYLFRLRTGLPIDTVAMLFGLAKTTLGTNMESIRKELEVNFVSSNLGYRAISREQALEHLTPQSRSLFPLQNESSLQSIWDGTYIYIQKSTNNEFQRMTYSGQKKTSLYKPMAGVLPDGYILDIIPKFPAISNDASILRDLSAESPGFRSFFRPGDCFILDRGFRDVVQTLRNQGYEAFHPAFLNRALANPRNISQLSAQQANSSRKLTKIRPVVERVFGRIKMTFRMFHHVIDNKYIENSQRDLRICAAIINKYHQRFYSDQGNEELIIQRIQERLSKEDKLANMVDDNNIHMHTAGWETFDPSREDIQPFTGDELYILSCGTYGPKWIDSYKTECRKKALESDVSMSNEIIGNHSHVILQQLIVCQDANLYERQLAEFGIDVDEPYFVRAKIASRHKNSKLYQVFVLVDNAREGVERAVDWYCKCNSGRRTVTPCQHALCVLSIVGSGFNSPAPACSLNSIFDRSEEGDEESSDEEW